MLSCSLAQERRRALAERGDVDLLKCAILLFSGNGRRPNSEHLPSPKIRATQLLEVALFAHQRNAHKLNRPKVDLRR